MQFNIISPSQFKTVRWKNGKGSTKELLFESTEDDDVFAWRLSMAPVTEDGQFSDFSGYDRTLILVEGNGITLTHDNGQVDELVQRFDAAKFDGGWATEATLQQSEITDFNVMTRQSICTAQVVVMPDIDAHEIHIDADQLLIYPVDNTIEILTSELENLELSVTNLLQVISPSKGVWKVNGEAVICIQISYY